MVVIRLARGGAKKRPFYQVVVADQRRARDGRYIENIGFFNPLAKESEEAVRLNMEAYNAWVAKGAQPSDRVASLAKSYNKAAESEATAARVALEEPLGRVTSSLRMVSSRFA